MPKTKPTTLLVFVQDETGSMGHISEQTISAFNEYFDTLKADSKDFGKVAVQAWQFSEAAGEDRVRELHNGVLSKTPKLTKGNYRPRGITPLLDAVGTALQQAETTKADRYLFVVQTDGLENASRDFDREQIRQLISEKESADNWTIVFLGAGISQWVQEAAAIGVQAGSTTSYSPHDTRASYDSLASHSSVLLSSHRSSDPQMANKVEQDVTKKRRKKNG